MSEIVRVPYISHQQLREHFKDLKNFDATLAFFRRIDLVPPSIRKGNISSLKRGNTGVHPGNVIGFLEKVFELRKQGKGYKQIKEELKDDIANVRGWYTRKDISLNDPRVKPDELLDTYREALRALEEYYGWKGDSYFSNFYKNLPNELIKLRTLYFNTVLELSIKGKTNRDIKLMGQKEQYGKQLDACFDTVYFIIRQYEKLRKGGKGVIGLKISGKEL